MGIMMLNNKVLMSGNQMALYVPPPPAKGGDYNIVQTNDGDNCSLAITDANTFVLTTKTITENGTYNASVDNADGYSQVTVNVASGGGGFETCTLTTSVGKAPGIAHGTIYAYNGDTLITITSKGTYSINKNSLIYINSASSSDEITGLEILYNGYGVSVCNVTSDIANYKFNI